MYYGALKTCDIANGSGVRVTLFVSGCTNACEGCFQKETWDFSYGSLYTKETEDKIIEALYPSYVQGLTLLGGEPFEIENQKELIKLVRRVKKEYPEKNIWCYTGFTLEKDLIEGGKRHCEATDEMLSYLDVLVDGKFEEDLKDIRLKFRGSSNQRLIDMNETRKQNKIVLLEL